MYMLLVDYNFISSEQLQKMIEKINPDADIVNCFSLNTLLSISKKLLPGIIVIDFDLVGRDQVGLIEQLREDSSDAHILALIDPDRYDNLYQAIELNIIDDYMVKPIQKEDFMARMRIVMKRKGMGYTGNGNGYDFDNEVDSYRAGRDNDIYHVPFREAVEPDEPADDESVQPFKEDFYPDEAVSESYPGIEDSIEPTEEQDVQDQEQEEKAFQDLPLEETGEQEPGIEDQDTGVMDSLSDFEEQFEDHFAEEDEFKSGIEPEEKDSLMPGPEETGAEEEYIPEAEKDFFSDLPELTDTSEEPFDRKFEPGETPFDPGPGPDTVRPAEEFLGRSTPPEEENLFTDQPVENEEEPSDRNRFFEEIFSDEPTTDEKIDNKKKHVDFDDDIDLSEPPPQTEMKPRELKISSSLPGKSADEFLFGDDTFYEPESEQDFAEDAFDEDEEGWAVDTEEIYSSRKKTRRERGKGGLRKTASIVGNVFFILLLLVMIALSFFLIQSRITGGVPQVGGYQMYIVLSGSMKPEFDTGSLIFVRETGPGELVVGDIITFRSPANEESLTTHRIVERISNEELKFVTRGDANNVNDPNPVPAENIVGKKTGSVPYLGYLLNFVQTREGLILLIFVPGILIIGYELSKIIKYMAGENSNKKGRTNGKNPGLAADGS